MNNNFDISKLEVGMEFKNNKVLCNFLNIEYQGGRSKESIIKELNRHVEYKRTGNAYEITKVYDSPKADLSTRGSKYGRYMDPILLRKIYEFFQSNPCERYFVIDIVHLATEIGLCNYEFDSFYLNRNDLVNKRLSNNYYKIRNEVKKIIESSIDRLVEKKQICCQKTYIVNDRYGESEHCPPYFEDYRLVTPNEHLMIENARETVEESLGYKKYVLYKFHMDEFLDERQKILDDSDDNLYHPMAIYRFKLLDKKNIPKKSVAENFIIELNRLYYEGRLKANAKKQIVGFGPIPESALIEEEAIKRYLPI